MMEQIKDDKPTVLAKLLMHGDEPIGVLVQQTGWSEKDTQYALLQLIAAGTVRFKVGSGMRVYGLRDHGSSRQRKSTSSARRPASKRCRHEYEVDFQ